MQEQMKHSNDPPFKTKLKLHINMKLSIYYKQQ